MTIEFQLQYLRQKALDKKGSELKNSNNTNHTNNDFMKKYSTKVNSITDMSSAYAEVRNSNHIPTEGEINLRRFLSGSYMDTNPLEKK